LSPRQLLLGVLLVAGCESAPYGDILNGKSCSAEGECAPDYQCIEGACVTTWLVIGGDDDGPLGNGGDGGSPGTGASTSAGAAPSAGGSPNDCVANGNCPPTLAQGTACTDAGQCISGNCVDVVCCDSACTGGCFACSAQQTDGPDGSCLPVSDGLAPAGDCPATEVCDGNGSCKCTLCNLPPGTVCANDAVCASGKCSDQDLICCDSDCNGTCVSCKGIETGASDGQCEPILFATDPLNECPGNDKCDGEGGCVECNGGDCGDD
jgi:hypothetical protein